VVGRTLPQTTSGRCAAADRTRSGLGVDFSLNRIFSKSTWDDDNRARCANPQVEDLLAKGRSTFD